MRHHQKKSVTLSALAATILCLSSLWPARAATTIYVGTNGLSATTNWSDTANFVDATSGAHETPNNNAANFNYNTATNVPGVITLVADGAYGTPGSGVSAAWAVVFGQTNGYHTVMVPPGAELAMIAANGTAGNGFNVGPQAANTGGGTGGGNVPTASYTNYTTIEGPGSFLVNGAFQLEGRSSSVVNHYTILDMSSLNTFTHTNTSSGSSRFLLVNNTSHSQGLIYLATNNFINIYSDVQVGWGSTSSNSLPIGLYLGMSNSITTGPNDSGNQLVVGIDGVTNAFMKFNPKFLNQPTKPYAYLSGNGSGVSGMMNWVAIGQSLSSYVPANAVVDLTGGIVNWNIYQLRLGRAGSGTPGAGLQANGTLAFDSGTINATICNIGSQEVSGGAPTVGSLFVGSNATFTASQTIYLPWVVGTPKAGSSGTINVYGGTLNAGNIIDTNDLGTLNLSNAVLGLTLPTVSSTATNVIVGTLGVTGTNTINISSITPFLGANATMANPIRFHLVYYTTLNGTINVQLGSLPASYDPSYSYGGYLDTATTPQTIDFVLTNAPPASRIITWSGTNGVANPDGNWDVGTTPDWLVAGAATGYNQFDLAYFYDVAVPAETNIDLTTTLTPYSVTVSNNASTYTFGGGGQISGDTSLIKEGTNTLILDENGGGGGYNSFTGGIGIVGGTLQVGNEDSSGTLSTGNVTNNGTLVFDMGAISPVPNLISGSGKVVEEGGDTLQLAGINTFTGSTLITNNSVLQPGNASSLGATNGAIVIANGSTLDLNGVSTGPLIGKPVNVQGAGVGGEGALVNNSGSGSGYLTNVTLSGDTTIGGSARLDIGGTLSAGGHAYNVTVTGSAYHEWSNLIVDTNLANITINGSATLGDKGTTALGNPADTVTVNQGATLVFYNNGAANVNLSKMVVIDDGATLQNGGGSDTIAGTVVLTNVDSSATPYCYFSLNSGTSLTLNGPLSGSGILTTLGGTGTLTINSSSPSFSGGAIISVSTLVLNGNFGTGPVTIESTLAGTGTAGGLVDVAGNLYPGTQGTAGTFSAAGGLTLEPNANVTFDLASTTGVGGGVNDLVAVTGDLTVNGNMININPLSNMPNGSTYTLFTYTGNLNGSFGGAQTVQTSQYTFQVNNITTTSPKQIQLVVTGGQPGPLLWNNASGNGEWDVQNSANWSNLVTHVPADYFYSFDSVTFDDSITNSATPSTAIDVASGQVVIPSVMTNNSTTNYMISGAGKISGAASIVKLGSSTLSISNMPNDFTGNITVAGGTLRAWWGPSELGSTNVGTIYITNGATLDRGWSMVKSIVVSGAGVNGQGAIVNNSSGNAIYDGGSGGLTPQLTLAGNTVFGGNTRTDLGGTGGATVSCLGGGNYGIVITNTSGTYCEWDNLTIDANLGNVDVNSGDLGIKGCGLSLGNPTNVITVHPGAELTFWGETANNSGYAKSIYTMTNGILQFRPQTANNYYDTALSLDGGSELDCFNGSGNGTVFMSPVTLNGLAHFVIGDSPITFSNVISGPGGFYYTSDNNSVVFTATNTYQGMTLIGSGMLLALSANGSISGSSDIYLTTGATLSVTNRVDDTLTLASGQVLQGGGLVNGMLNCGAGSIVSPGTNTDVGVLTVSSNATLNGIALFKLNAPTNDVLSVAGTVTYGGTLAATNISATPLAAGNSFKLFNAAVYAGSFTATNLPALGTGLGWNWSPTNGVLSVVQTINLTPTNIMAAVSGNVLTLSWPSDHTGWRLEVQTNPISSGLNPAANAWYTVPGSTSTDSETINLDPTQGTIFYRMVYP